MVTFQVDFEPHPLEKQVVAQIKEDMRSKLDCHEFSRLKVTLRRNVVKEIVPLITGDEEDVAKAKRLLGLP